MQRSYIAGEDVMNKAVSKKRYHHWRMQRSYIAGEDVRNKAVSKKRYCHKYVNANVNRDRNKCLLSLIVAITFKCSSYNASLYTILVIGFIIDRLPERTIHYTGSARFTDNSCMMQSDLYTDILYWCQSQRTKLRFIRSFDCAVLICRRWSCVG